MMLGWIFGNLTMMLVCPIIPITASITPLVNILESPTSGHCRHPTTREVSWNAFFCSNKLFCLNQTKQLILETMQNYLKRKTFENSMQLAEKLNTHFVLLVIREFIICTNLDRMCRAKIYQHDHHLHPHDPHRIESNRVRRCQN